LQCIENGLCQVLNLNDKIDEILISNNYNYRMTNEYIGKNLALEAIDKNNASAIIMAPINNNPGQYWRIVQLENNVYSLHNRLFNDSYSAEIIDDEMFMKLRMAPTRNSREQHWCLFSMSNHPNQQYWNLTRITEI